MRTLLIDNYDSFTQNLYHLLAEVNGREPTVIRNDDGDLWKRVDPDGFDAVVISPGPGKPGNERDFGLSRTAIEDLDLPLLGVCLGHQGLCHLAGASVRHAPEPVHGRISEVWHNGGDLFAGIPSPFGVVRYHSLLAYDLPPSLEPIATTADGLLMAVRHRERPHWGVQFHPESILTEHGHRLMRNFRRIAEDWNAARGCRPRSGSRPRAGLYPGASPGRDSTRARQPGAQEHAQEHEQEQEQHRPPARYRLHVRELAAVPAAEDAFGALFAGRPGAFWLDSSRVIPGLSRFSFLGAADGPLAEMVSYDVSAREVTVRAADGHVIERRAETIFGYLERELAARQVAAPGLPFEFNLGYVGYLGYELKADCGADRPHQADQADAALVFCDRMIAIDHQDDRAWLLALSADPRSSEGPVPGTAPGPDRAAGDAQAHDWLTAAAAALTALAAAPAAFPRGDGDASPAGAAGESAGAGAGYPQVRFRHEIDDYRRLVKECQREISDGESYEICLTNMLTIERGFDPTRVYAALRRVSPAPYAALLAFPGFSVLSSSPERFLSISAGGVVESKPIKGTRRRGDSDEEDLELIADLRNSVKDRAENLMIVDLVRNDLGTEAEVGSVHVPTIFGIETYATVHQLVSTIRAQLRSGASPVACVRAGFPGGSMTGAPKLRTLELIDKFENGARGIYSGALGWFALSGAVDLSIVIRTIIITPDRATMGVGGAITALSDPEDEVTEMLLKADALLRALREADQGRP